jgi:hypothetical protein
MSEITLESLAARLESVEKRLDSLAVANTIPPARDWRSVVGLSHENEFTRDMYAEMESLREAEREAARAGAEQ